jgi:hypothetical protein
LIAVKPMPGKSKQKLRAVRAAAFEASLLTFDKTAVRAFSSFEEVDREDREYWFSRTPQERMQALEHIRSLAWGYDAQTQPPFQRTVRVLKLGES